MQARDLMASTDLGCVAAGGLNDAALVFALLAGLMILLAALIVGVRANALGEAHSRLVAHLEKLAMIDSVTGLYNRRLMDETLEREVIRARRTGMPLALVMIDIDHFKHYNDTFGHAAGDRVLRSVGEILKRDIRGSDAAYRYGGEEFIVVMPEIGTETARARAEALRLAIHELRAAHHGTPLGPITVSVGLAALPTDGCSAAALLAAADTALYEAKRSGRNRLVVCAEFKRLDRSAEGRENARSWLAQQRQVARAPLA
jgi:diguanylate cyclase (GGDEF)-like protein